MTWIKEEKLYFIIMLMLILIMAIRTPLDSDLWWHLRAGEETWSAGEVYRIDNFSFTRSGANWINHSWLSQVLIYLLYRVGNYWALSLLVGLCAAGSIALIYPQMEGHPLFRMGVCMFAGIVSSVVWTPRPQVISLVFLSGVSYIFYLYKWRQINRLVWLLPIFILWGNLHGGYVLGVILLGSMLVGEILFKVIAMGGTHQMSWPQIRSTGLVLVGIILVVLINPFGLDVWKIPFNTVGVQSLQNLIDEWASPDFHQAFQQPMLLMLITVISALAISKERIEGGELVCLVVFSWLALTARRNFGPFAIIAGPILTRSSSNIWKDWKGRLITAYPQLENQFNKITSSNSNIKPTLKNIINVILLVLMSAGVFWKAYEVNLPSFVRDTEEEYFPVEAVEILRNEEKPGNILNEYNWGGYLIYHLRDFPVFVDGRTDLYGDEIITEWADLLQAKGNWEKNLLDREIEYILINSGRTLAFTLSSDWKSLYQDEVITLFGRDR